MQGSCLVGVVCGGVEICTYNPTNVLAHCLLIGTEPFVGFIR